MTWMTTTALTAASATSMARTTRASSKVTPPSTALTPPDPNTVFGSALDNPDTMFDMNTTFFEKEIKNNNFGEQLIPALRRIQAVRVNYMRTAKRVDVKLLKDNLWKKIVSGTRDFV